MATLVTFFDIHKHYITNLAIPWSTKLSDIDVFVKSCRLTVSYVTRSIKSEIPLRVMKNIFKESQLLGVLFTDRGGVFVEDIELLYDVLFLISLKVPLKIQNMRPLWPKKTKILQCGGQVVL